MSAFADFDEYARARWLPLLRTATLLTGDPHAAEDLVQDALARAAQRWTVIAEADSPDAYVRRILYTRSIDAWRRTRHEPTASAHVGWASTSPDTAPATDTRVTL